jgi:acyl-CoA thioesterase-1
MNPTLAIVLLTILSVAATAQDGSGGRTGAEVAQPFWKSPVMVGESLLFVKRGGKPATGQLIFTPTKILAVRSSSGATTYEAGKDYQFTPGSRVITIPAGSAIPVTAAKQLTPTLGSQPFDLKRRDGKGDILFGEGHEYAGMQVEVTYEHEQGDWKPAPPVFAKVELPVVLKKLQDGEPVSIVFFGDSITVGGNASKFTNVAPFQPAYPELTIRNLERAYKSKIIYKNFSVGGMAADYGLKNIAKVVAEKPDLVVLAWGMNDSSGKTPRPTSDFINDIAGQIEAIVKQKPDTEFILVSSMLPNADCYWANPQALLGYRDVMRKHAGQGTVVADLTSVWEELLKTKSYLDITGNGINHPNDFGHRLYADVLSALLIQQ